MNGVADWLRAERAVDEDVGHPKRHSKAKNRDASKRLKSEHLSE
jgi:hypothetical protein